MSYTTKKSILALKKVRKDLISLFTSNKIKHPTDYDISSATGNEFTISFLKRQNSLSAKMVQILKSERSEKITIRTADINRIRITIRDIYTRQFLNDIEQSGNEQSTTKKLKVGRPKEEFGIFISQMIEFIELKSGVKHKANPGFYITLESFPNNKQVAVINCGDKYVTSKIICGLEIDNFYLSRLKYVDDKHIHISMVSGLVPEIKIRNDVIKIITNLEKEASNYNEHLDLHRETSVFFAQNENPIEIAYVLKNDQQAQMFADAIEGKCKVKKDGKQIRLFFDEATILELQKVENFLLLSDNQKGFVTIKSNTSGDVKENYVYSSSDYSDFLLLPFNRDVKKSHVMKLVKSMEKHGVTSFVTVVITDCIDGVMRKWVVDGQHRLAAFQFRNTPVLYTVVRASSKKEIVRLIADLNTTSRKWTTRNFLNAWHSLKIRDYEILKGILDETKLPLGFLLETLTEFEEKKAMGEFNRGDFEIVNEERGLRHIDYIMSLKPLLPRSYRIYSALVFYFRKCEEVGEYNNEVMVTRLQDYSEQIIFGTGITREHLVLRIDAIYTGQLLVPNE